MDTPFLGNLTPTRFVNYHLEEFIPTMIERCQKGDLLFPPSLPTYVRHGARKELE